MGRCRWFEENEVLFGADPEEGIVAVDLVDSDKVGVYKRAGGRLHYREEEFRPFVLIEDPSTLNGLNVRYRVEELAGGNEFRWLVRLDGWDDCLKARSYLHRATGHLPSSPQASYLFLNDPVQQFLILSGKTLFKGMEFQDLHRMALDIETDCAPGYEFSNSLRPEDKIISIALMDNRGFEEVIFGGDMEEGEMILALGDIIRQKDPDVIEGHNLFNFDLDYILTRAKLHGVELPWGRDGSVPSVRRSRFSVAERTIDYTRTDLFGRHLVDTYFLLQYYDVTARELESYGLKAAAKHFGLSDEGRTYIERGEIQRYFREDPEALKRYNLDDVRETLALSELLAYPFFLQCSMFPFSYQNIFVRGNATKINALFLREYLRRRASIPKPRTRSGLEGGYTDCFVQGVVRRVVHCDVTSLYPSIMVTYGIKPRGDTLDVFLPMLLDLRRFRIEAKRNSLEEGDPRKRKYFGALQQTFKTLINSFYGYLGTERQHFSDPEAASHVTRVGREILRQMLQWLEGNGAIPVELDTDGIYFVPPDWIITEGDAQKLVMELSKSLPEGIEVEMDGFYPAMFSYKRKNYALLDDKGRVLIRGSALRSRGMEGYLREFLWEMIRLLLEDRSTDIEGLYEDWMERLSRHEVDIRRLAKTETLADSLEVYRQKVRARRRNVAATYELAIAAQREYRAGDQVSYYVTGDKKRVRVYENCKLLSEYDPTNPDENVAYYKAKLEDLFKKFKPFLDQRRGQVPA